MGKNGTWKEKSPEKRFINPYNFVSLGSETQRSEQPNGELTGKITVSLVVKTPLAVPDTEKIKTKVVGPNEKDKHKIYPFFRVDGKPVIPGSQLRGMIRSAYETISNSCFSVNNNNIMSARHANPGKPGLVQFKDGKWHLYEASSQKDYGQDIKDDNSEVKRTWYNIRGKIVKTKIFSKGSEVECVNLEEAIKNYKENKDIYAKGSYFKKYKPVPITYGIEKGRLNPVFYETVEFDGKKYVYLSLSQMGRYVFNNRLDDLLGSHAACAKKSGTELCKACTLFGMIPDSAIKERKACAGKLRFSDAQVRKFESMGEKTLKELASPKITSVEFYTVRPKDALYWTFDYRIDSYKKARIDIPVKEKYDVTVRGRKYYLHNPLLNENDYSTKFETIRNSTMELCKPGSKFSFDIYFEKISEKQLKELLWTITIGENSEDGMQMHKLGHGKPLGLGSVKLVAEDVMIRSFDAETFNYTIRHMEKAQIDEMIAGVDFDTESSTFADFMKITRFDGLKDIMESRHARISYPVADSHEDNKNSRASHQWFIGNRSMGKDGTETAWSVKYVLPKITSKNPTLPALEIVPDKSGDSTGYSSSGQKSPRR